MMQRYKLFFISVAMVAAVLAAYVGGYAVGRGEAPSAPAEAGRASGNVSGQGSEPSWLSKDADFGVYWDVWKWVQDHYIDRPVAEPKLLYASLMGLVAGLDDPYSVFLEPRDAEEFSQELQGTFEGIGAEIGIRESRLTVVSPLAESPAEKAGLKPLDWIMQIDEHDTLGMNLEDAVRKIRGARGTEVRLRIMREGFDGPREFGIVRDDIVIVSVTHEVKEGGVGYIAIKNFHADTNERFRQAVSDLLGAKVSRIILDVRSDPGGYLNSAVEIASYWIEEGKPVVLERTADARTKEYRAVRNQVLAGMPTAVLVNRGSASASEIVAGALQDYGAATVVGETTFGKGSIQEVQDFSDGSAVKLTVARWLTPKERQIDGDGIAPDVAVAMEEEDVKNANDPQLEKALEILTNEESARLPSRQGITN